ncbi:hypothetical protein OUZ56_014213 [Daphnia magna]|uniref:Uncharacterized protein n=1 Tax=Daphnia magna TaxID=35525 RepID=A0ABQ9Z852_9CRUS|nr:hypothetical protein OUZ56_014213 [Daphnia magna]
MDFTSYSILICDCDRHTKTILFAKCLCVMARPAIVLHTPPSKHNTKEERDVKKDIGKLIMQIGVKEGAMNDHTFLAGSVLPLL